MSKLFFGSDWSVKDKSYLRDAGRNSPDDVVVINGEKGASVYHPHPYISMSGYDKSDYIRAERKVRLIKSAPEMYEILDGILQSGIVKDDDMEKIGNLIRDIN